MWECGGGWEDWNLQMKFCLLWKRWTEGAAATVGIGERMRLETAHDKGSGQLLQEIPEGSSWEFHLPYLPVGIYICSHYTKSGVLSKWGIGVLFAGWIAASVHVPCIWPIFGFLPTVPLICIPFPPLNLCLDCSSCKQQLVLDPSSHNPHSSNRNPKPHLFVINTGHAPTSQ